MTAETAESVSVKGGYRMLDAWRGIASIWVVMVHACLPAIASGYAALAQQPFYRISLWGYLGVPLFFVISGYCIANAAISRSNSINPPARFLRARFLRIYPPYFLVSLFAIFLSSLAALLARHGYFRGSALAQANFFHHPAVYYLSALTLTQVPLRQDPLLTVFWSLCYEVTFYGIVSVLLIQSLRLSRPQTLLTLLHGVTLGALLWLIVSPRTCVYPLDLWPQFGLGILVFDWLKHSEEKRPKLFLGLAAVLTLAFVVLQRAPTGSPLLPSSRVTFSLALGFALLLVALHRFDARLMAWKPLRLLASVGAFSYSLYLTHLLSLGVVSQIGKKLGVTEQTYIFSDLAQIALALVVAWFFYLCCERPFHQAARSKPAALAAG